MAKRSVKAFNAAQKKKAKAKRKTVKKKVKRKTKKKAPARKTTKKRKPAAKKKKAKAKAKKKPKNLATRAKAELKKNPKSQRKVARKLTAKQIMFVDCYLGAAKRTATLAALMAGYSKKSVNSEASQLMANPKVKSYLKRRQDDLRRRTNVTEEKIVKELAVLAFSKPSDYVEWHGNSIYVSSSNEIPDCLQGAIKSLEPVSSKDDGWRIKITFYDKIAAMRLLAQHLGMLGDRPGEDHKGTIVKFMEGVRDQAGKLDGKGEDDETGATDGDA